MGYGDREDPPDTPWAALVHRETKWISIGKSYAMAPEGKGYGKWELISDKFTEDEANRYVRMNWKDRLFTPYEQAKVDRERGLVPYCKMDDEEFEALFYRQTLEEFMEVWTLNQLGEIAKPAGLYDVNGYYQPLMGMVDHMIAEKFLPPSHRDAVVVQSSPEGLVDGLINFVPFTTQKWMS